MSGKGSQPDPRLVATLRILQKAPILTVPQAMRAAKFSDRESREPTLQQQVRRLVEKSNRPSKPRPNPTSPVPNVGTVLTALKAPPPPEIVATRRSSVKVQRDTSNAAQLKSHTKKAHKRATTWSKMNCRRARGLSAPTRFAIVSLKNTGLLFNQGLSNDMCQRALPANHP